MSEQFQRLLATTAKRSRRRVLLVGVSKALLWALLTALFIRVVYEFHPLPFGLLAFAAIPVLVTVGTVVYVLRRAYTTTEAARSIDDVLGGDDRFSTALECLGKRERNDVETELLSRIDKECATIEPSRVIPIRTPGEAKALALVLPIFLAVLAWTGYQQLLLAITPIVQRTALAKPIRHIEDKVAELSRSEDPRKKAVADKLKKLLGELKDAKDFDSMLGQAKRLLEQLKEAETDPEAKKAIEQMGRVAEYLARSKVTRQIADALKEGDMEKAADLTRTLAERIRKSTGMTPQDLQRLAQNFKRSANVTNDPNAPMRRSDGG